MVDLFGELKKPPGIGATGPIMFASLLPPLAPPMLIAVVPLLLVPLELEIALLVPMTLTVPLDLLLASLGETFVWLALMTATALLAMSVPCTQPRM